MFDSDLPGTIAGVAIAAIVISAVLVYLRPLRGQQSGIGLAFVVLVAVWLLKTVALRWFSGYFFDIDQFRRWALRIAEVGPAHFYGPGYTYRFDYPPGGIYVLWPFGSIARILGLSGENLRILLETPPLLADLLVGSMMFAYLRRSGWSFRIASAGTLLVALNPALLFDTVVWGQTDSVVTSLMWLTTILAIEGEYTLAAAILAISVLVKPHALIMIPPLACWVLRKGGLGSLWAPIAVFAVTMAVAVAPFAVGHPWDWLPRFYSEGMAAFRETSVNAFNFMAIVGGMRQPETTGVLGVSDFDLGLALVILVVALSCVHVWLNPTRRSLTLAIFLALFGEFVFGPRMHERYLYPALVFFAPTALEGVFWVTVFALLTMNWLFNLAYVLRTLETVYWLPVHAAPAMLSGALNLILFGAVLSRLTTFESRSRPSADALRPILTQEHEASGPN